MKSIVLAFLVVFTFNSALFAQTPIPLTPAIQNIQPSQSSEPATALKTKLPILKIPDGTPVEIEAPYCNLKRLLAATGSNYLPQVYKNSSNSDLDVPPSFEFWKLPLPEVQRGS
ncbi:MAG TPA: hypothetical protein VN951_01615 [Pyrinomonadaceae bacterium]|nr:hypothetical protein [Pyrinomonadaceae bacterium]